MKTIAKLVIKFGVLFIILNMGITAFLGAQLPKLKINNETETFIPADHPAQILNNHLKDVFGDNNLMILAIEAKQGTIYQEPILRKIAGLTDKIETLDNVEEVTSLTNVDNIIGTDEGMQVEPIFDIYEEINDDVLKNIKEVLHSWSFYEGGMISGDDRATVVIIEFPKHADIKTKEALHTDLTKVMNDFSFDEVNLYLAGKPVAEVEMGHFMQSDMKRLIPFVLAVIALVLFISFRSFLGVMLPLTCIVMATVNSMGLMSYLGHELTIMGTIIPVVLVAIGSAYSIHVIHHFFIDLHKGMSAKKAIEETFDKIGLSVILAGLTTMAGFGSLGTSAVIPIRDFGLFVAFGTGVALVVALTFIPPVLILLSRFKPSIEAQAADSDSHTGINKLMAVSTQWILSRSRYVVIFSIILVALSILSSLRLQSYSDMLSLFPPKSQLRQANDWINENLTGTSSISVIISGEKDSIKEPEVLRQIEELQRHIEKEFPFISKSISLVDFLKRMNFSMNANNSAFDKIPQSKELVAQYLLLYSTSGDPDDFDAYVDYDYKEARIIFQSKKSRTLDNNRVLEEVVSYTKEHFDPALKVQVSGQPAITRALNKLIITGQISSVIASIVIVFLLMTFVFRSIVGGLLSILPLTLSILFNFGLMPLVGIPLDIGTAIFSSIAVGVGIDYAIHYINNSRLEAGRHHSLESLYAHTAVNSGTAILFNALAVALGFLVLTYSNFGPLIRMGSLVSLTMVVSSVGSLVFIPALIKTLKPKFINLKS
jgi:predicted RND superfamily exporter protein